MLTFKELEVVARLKRLSLINAEKDYLQELMLFSLYSRISDELVFKGGTCIYKFYKLNRFSEDLDFTLRKSVDLKKVVNKVIVDLELLNIKGKIKEVKEYKNEINIRILLNGPLYKGSKVTQCFLPINVSLKEGVIFEPKKESLISMYKEIPNFEAFIMDEREILAEKVRAIMTREKPRDVYDLWFLLNAKNVGFGLELVNKKLGLYGLKFNRNEFVRKVDSKKGLWETDLKSLIIGSLPDFSVVKKQILERISGR